MTDDELRNRLIERIQQLSGQHLLALEQWLVQMECAGCALPDSPPVQPSRTDSPVRDWPHAPVHRLSEHGTFLVTAGTLYKHHHFPNRQRLDLVEAKLLELARQYGWHLEAWAVFSSHYHFVGHSQATSAPLNDFLG